MPRPGEDRSDVGGAAQFNNIGPVPLSRFPSRFPAFQYRTRPAFRFQKEIAQRLGLESAYRPTGRPRKVGRNQNASPG